MEISFPCATVQRREGNGGGANIELELLGEEHSVESKVAGETDTRDRGGGRGGTIAGERDDLESDEGSKERSLSLDV